MKRGLFICLFLFTGKILNGFSGFTTQVHFLLPEFSDTLVIAVRNQDKWHYNPKKDQPVKTGDHIVVLTIPVERQKLEKKLA